MLRFIRIPAECAMAFDDEGRERPCFAWFDTVTSGFLDIGGFQMWESWEEFVEDWKLDEQEGRAWDRLERFAGLYVPFDEWNKAPGSGSASAEAVPGDGVGNDHAGEGEVSNAPAGTALPLPGQEPLSVRDARQIIRDMPGDAPGHGDLLGFGYVLPPVQACGKCHRSLPLCEC